MTTTAASTALRRCLRSKNALAACRQNPARSKRASIASSICPARTLSSTAPSPLSSKPSTQALLQAATKTHTVPSATRAYSSSIQGTIGKGQQGRADEASREQEAIEVPEHLNDKEREIWGMLQRELKPTKLEVQDISGGCGSMYGIEVVSERFRGLSMLRQQRLVNQVLGEEIRGWHGVQLRTSVP